MSTTESWWLPCFLFCSLFFCVCEEAAFAKSTQTPRACRSLLQGKQWLAASRCYFQKATGLRAKKGTFFLYKAGLAVRTGLFCLEQAWKKKTALSQRSWVAERLVHWSEHYLRHKMFSSPQEKEFVSRMKTRYQKRIGWVQLKINAPGGVLTLLGFRTNKLRSVRRQIQWRVRPGLYQLKVRWPGGHKQSFKLHLQPFVHKELSLQPPPKVPTPRQRPKARRSPPKQPPKEPKPKPPHTLGGLVAVVWGGCLVDCGCGVGALQPLCDHV